MRKYLILLFAFFITTSVSQTLLSLEDAIKIAFDKSFEMKAAKYSKEMSELRWEAARLGLYSSVDLNFELPSYESALRSEFNPATGKDEFYKTKYQVFQGALSINQPIILTNGRLSLSGLVSNKKQWFKDSDSKDYYTNLKITLTQPLFAYNDQAASLRQTEIQQINSERDYTRAEFDIIYNVTENFFNLLKTKKQVAIQQEEVKQKELSYETTLNKYKAGLIAEGDVLKFEVELATSRNSLLDYQRNYEEQKNNFKLLVGIDFSENIDVEENLVFSAVEVEIDPMIKLAFEKRPDLLKAETNIELNEMNIDRVDAEHRIRVSLNASYGVNNTDEKYNNLLKEMDESRSVSLNLSVPVWDWGSNRKQVQAEEINLKLSKDRLDNLKKGIQREIISAVNRINSAKAKVEVLEKSVIVAEKSYDISIERFKVGKISSLELSQVQLNLTQTRLSNLEAIIQYKLAIADLERKTLTKIRN